MQEKKLKLYNLQYMGKLTTLSLSILSFYDFYLFSYYQNIIKF